MRRANIFSTLLFSVACLALVVGTPSEVRSQTATVYEGARLITGDGAVIENSGILVEGGRFTQVGRRADIMAPANARRVDLSGKTVMPTMTDLHGHFGFQNIPEGTMSKETFTRENLIDHMQRLAYHGVGAAVGVGDLVDRSDMKGGRTGWGDVVLKLRDEVVPGAALFKTSGPGMMWPGAGAQGHRSRADVMYPVTTIDEVRAAVADYVRIKPEFIKIWVDDREGRMKTLPPELYRAIVEEADKFGVPVGVHNTKLVDAKGLLRAGVEGWLHTPVRGGDHVDDEVIGIVKDRIARNFHPTMWVTPGLQSAWMNSQGTTPVWLDDPLLKATYSAAQIKEYWSDPLAKLTPAQVERAKKSLTDDGGNMMKLRAAGMKVVMGTDTGQTRFFIGYYNHMVLESYVAMGMTSMEVIIASTRDSAALGHFNTGVVAPDKQADFMVLDANPLDNIANTRKISAVYLRGAEVPRAQLATKWQSQFRTAAAR